MPKRNRTPLRCIHCGVKFPRAVCAGLFCGDDCAVQHEAFIENARHDLKAAGFVIHPEASNLWVKDGAAISEEHVKNIGITKALKVHISHVEGLKLAQQSQG